MKKILFYFLIASGGHFLAQNSVANCATLTTSGSGVAWTVNSPATASVNLATPGISQIISGTNYGFNIPAGATILGIQINSFYTVNFTTTSVLIDTVCVLLKGGTPSGIDKHLATPNFTAGFGTLNLGGSSDLWGTTWTPAQINASNFGFRFQLYTPGGFTVFNILQGFPITVYYSNSVGITESQYSDATVLVYGKKIYISNGKTNQSLIVNDISGKLVMSSKESVTDISELMPGVYYYQALLDGQLKKGKFIVD